MKTDQKPLIDKSTPTTTEGLKQTISLKTSYRHIVTHSSIYIFGMLISKLVGFVMIPIYTRYLTPADYGVLELLTMTSDVIAMLVGAGLAHSVLRFYYNYDTKREKNEVVSTALITGLAVFVFVFGFLSLQSGFISRVVLGNGEPSAYFTIIFITMMLFAGVEIPLVFLRAKQRSIYFVMVNLVKLVIQLSLNIYFIVVLKMGIFGVLYSSLIATIIIGGFLTIKTFLEVGIHFSRPKLYEMLLYGYPLIFTSLGAFLLTYSDRYFLKYYTDLSEVGIYSLGYKFGMMVSILILAPFQQFWAAEMFAVAKRDDAAKVFRDFFTYTTFISILFCFGLSIYIPDAIRIIASQAYWRAFWLVPLISLAYLFIGMHGFVNCGMLITKKTRYLAYSTGYAVAANIALNFLLIPRWGGYGAAISTVISFGLRFITVYIYSQRLYPLKYEWKRITIALSLAAAMVALSFNIDFHSLSYNLTFESVLFIGYIMILYFGGWFKPEEKMLIRKAAKSPTAVFKSIMEIQRSKS